MGWSGGDEYLKRLKKAFKAIKPLANLKIITYSNESIYYPKKFWFFEFSEAKKVYIKEHATYFPWSQQLNLVTAIQWVPDLQEIELPHYFDDSERKLRNDQIMSAITRGTLFYFSSKHAESVFKSHYSTGQSLGVLNFATNSLVRYSQNLNLCTSCKTSGFYYLPNQWWSHKGHLEFLESYREYVDQGGRCHLILSGDQSDYRSPVTESLILNKISNFPEVHNLGYVTEEIRNSLILKCRAIIQPSKYEGWSTTIEEAISHNKLILARNLKVNFEQLKNYKNARLLEFNDSFSVVKALLELEGLKSSRQFSPYVLRVIRFYFQLYKLLWRYRKLSI